MGIYNRDYIREDRPAFLRADHTVIPWLIGVNVVVFLLDVASQRQLTHWLSLDLRQLWPRFELWRLLTCGFCHADVGHLFGNMLGLFVFGQFVEPNRGPREFLAFYLVGIVVSSLAFLGLTGSLNLNAAAVGASGGVLAVTILAAMHFPMTTIRFMFVLPIQLRWLALFTVIADLSGYMGGRGGVAHSAHLGGAAFGFLYYRQQWSVLAWMPKFRFRLPRRRPPVRLYRPAEEEPVVSEATLDALLAKVSAQGEASLTDEERKTLVAASEQARRRRLRS